MELKPEIFFIITLVICGIGLAGNTLMCVMLLFQKELRRSHTTNYLLLGLTLSDTLLLVKSTLNTLKSMNVIVLDSPEALRILMYLWDWMSKFQAYRD